MSAVRTRRLVRSDREPAKRLFAMMAEVFAEDHEPLSDQYVDGLLSRDDFWAIAAFRDGEIVGGITAHTLPLTRMAASEIFIYDVAVRADQQRTGVGRQLMTDLRKAAAAAGIRQVFVAADNIDVHAVDFYRALGGVPFSVTFFTFAD